MRSRDDFEVTQLGTDWARTIESENCILHVRDTLPGQGYYRVTLTLHTDWGVATGVSEPTSRVVGVRDHLIVSIGDSLASGEGNPDVPGKYSFNLDFDWPPAHIEEHEAAVWQDRPCHRSAKSGPSLAAKAFEDATPNSVTFISVACSGAELQHLVATSYAGIVPNGATTDPPQLEAVANLVGPGAANGTRAIDALLVSGGINDLSFSGVIERCAKNNNFSRDAEDCVTSGGIAEAAQLLPLKYLLLGFAIIDQLPGTKEVYFNNYPSEVFDGG